MFGKADGFCGGLSIYLYIEEGPARRVNASISEREAVEESSTSVVCRKQRGEGLEVCGEGRPARKERYMPVKRFSMVRHESRPQQAMMLRDLTGCDRRGHNRRWHRHGRISVRITARMKRAGRMWQRWKCRALEHARTLGGGHYIPGHQAFCIAALRDGLGRTKMNKA